MCRWLAYTGRPLYLEDFLFKPENSLINQSLHARKAHVATNGDGFGVGWYAPEVSHEPAVFRSFTPAWSNRNLINLARVTHSPCVLAHVRAATPGLPVSELDCHPFSCGQFAMMHNGDLGGFREIRRKILDSLTDRAFAEIHGGTDSEHMFAIVLDRLWESRETDPLERLAGALSGMIRDVREIQRRAKVDEPSYLNIALSDGRQSVAIRFTTDDVEHCGSLYLHTGRRYVCDGDVCRMVDPLKGEGAVLVASEPLSDDPGWQKVPPNHMVLVRADRTVDVRGIAA